MKRSERERFRREVSFMFQSNALFDSLTVQENIALPLQEGSRIEGTAVREKVSRKMKAMDLEGTEEKYPSQLSGGMQKRVALARETVTDPDTVLFDEPTKGLDPVRKNSVLSMITSNQKNYGFTAVLVSHDVPDVFYISNRIAVLEEGWVIYQGTPQDLEQKDHPVLQEYVSSQEILSNEIYGLTSAKWLKRSFASLQKESEGRDAILLVITLPDYYDIMEHIGYLLAEIMLGALAQAFSRASQWNHACIVARYRENRIVCLCDPSAKERDPETVLQGVASQVGRMNFCSAAIRDRQTVFSVEGGWERVDSDRPLARQVQDILQNTRSLRDLTCRSET